MGAISVSIMDSAVRDQYDILDDWDQVLPLITTVYSTDDEDYTQDTYSITSSVMAMIAQRMLGAEQYAQSEDPIGDAGIRILSAC